jgi:hypothetical protein
MTIKSSQSIQDDQFFSRKTLRILVLFLSILCIILVGYQQLLTISNNPLPMFWSEPGRIFNAFQIYAPLITGETFTLPWLDPARAILDGVVLPIPGLQLWMWRFWIVFTEFTATIFVAFLILRQAKRNLQTQCGTGMGKIKFWSITLVSTLFLFQGPIYGHLLVCVIPVLAFYQSKKPVKNIVWLIVAAIWAGLTRVNWFLMPAIIMAILYLLQKPKGNKTLISYIKWPIIYGIINMLISLSVYMISLSMSDKPSILSPIMNYAFIKSKLYPNQGFSLGLVLGVTLISLPLLIVIVSTLWGRLKWYNGWRVFFILTILGILGAGSTLVSLRAGGGYDLHNYDTFLLVFLICGIYIGLGAISKKPSVPKETQRHLLMDNRVLVALMIFPLIFSVMPLNFSQEKSYENITQTIEEIDIYLQEAKETSDLPILFIDYRHLILFDYISVDSIYVPYEKIELMEMAMANNDKYFESFHSDLENQKFSLIVTGKLYPFEQRVSDSPYWYENNVWVQYVATPILEHYERYFIDDQSGIGIYSPIVYD